MAVFKNVTHVKVLIVDDDVLICETLHDILIDLGLARIKMVHNKQDLLNLLTVWVPDFILLDIRMERNEDGFVIGSILNEKNIPFIFVTAQTDSETTRKVIETHPEGFISKPIRTSELTVSIGLILKKLEGHNNAKLKIKHNNETIFINHTGLLYVKSDGNYLELFTLDKKYVIRSTIEQLLSDLDSPIFERIHRSIIVNKNYIVSVSPSTVSLKNNITLPLSRSFSKQLKD